MTATRSTTRRRRRQLLRLSLLSTDVVMVAAATVLASLVRFEQVRHVEAIPGFGLNIQFADLSLVILVIWVASLWFEGLYDVDRVFQGTGEYSRVARALSLGVVAFIVATYMLKIPTLSRGWLVLAWGFGILFVVFGRAVVRSVMAAARRRGRWRRPTLVVGYNQEAADLIRRLRGDASSGLDPVACLASSREGALGLEYCTQDVECLGAARDIKQVLDEHVFDTVLIASTAFDPEVLSRLIIDLRGRDVGIELSSGLLDVTTSRVLVREVSGVPLITLRGVSFSRGKKFVKRTFDLLVGGLIVLLGTPLWLVCAVLIKAESRGPVFYRQERVGRAGGKFMMYKFRSMKAGSDSKRDELGHHNEATGPLFKMQNDPRVTRVGKWMRKFSIDEFPQLLNVILGEMSLVGPRPPLPSETSQYSEYHWRRMEVLPGMTGLWQVSGRSRLTFDEMIRLDLFYIENWSVGMDMALIVRTVPAVLFARGAY
jgi:exopolysaccharide biosynthesis polyprenyl glycosylphosphotransferase